MLSVSNGVRASRKLALVLVALVALATGACGDSGEDPSPREQAKKQTAASAPERIVSLSPTATEMLFAIGAGKQVVAVDDQSDHPEGVPKTDLSGYQPNLEAIAGYEPDLVVIERDTGDLKAGLEELGATVLVQSAAATLDDTYAQIEALGEATGHEEAAAELVAEMRADIRELVRDVPAEVKGMTYYHELDPTFYSVTSSTFIGSVYGLLGLKNIADAVDDPAGGYPQLSAEYIVAADPQIIFLADTVCCGQDPAAVAARPGWSGITAVEKGAVVGLNDSIASRWGPRVVEFLRVVVKELSAMDG